MRSLIKQANLDKASFEGAFLAAMLVLYPRLQSNLSELRAFGL
jgi:hypothetical protein